MNNPVPPAEQAAQDLLEDIRKKHKFYDLAEVQAGDIDALERLSAIQDRSYRLRTVLEAWKQQQDQERELRRTYARGFLLVAALQLVAVNVLIFLTGFRILHLDRLLLELVVVSILGEVIGMVLVVARRLFPEIGHDLLSVIERL